MSIPSKVAVVIVGAGPAGLAADCTLLNDGVDVMIIDSNVHPSTASRATVIHSRTLEILEKFELIEDVMRQGDKLTKWNLCDKKSVFVDLDFSILQCKYPMVVTLPQSETEALLSARVKKLGGTIARGIRATKVEDRGDHVHVEIETTTEDGQHMTNTTVTAEYVIAADGLKSTVRESLSIPFEEGEYNASFITADCRLSAIGNLKEKTIQLYLHRDGFVLFVPEPRDIWRIVATMDPAPKNADVALFQHLVDDRCGPGIKVTELTWTSRFHVHHRLAKKFRKGRIFLAGDAAHVHSPAGGQGMNTGIQDGARLGQILAAALKDGLNTNADLDRYEDERRPIARAVVALTHRMTVVGTLQSPTLRFLRDWFLWGMGKSGWVRYYLVSTLAEVNHA